MKYWSSHALLLLTILMIAPLGDRSVQEQDPFQQIIARFELNNETIFQGIARLSQATDIAFAIEAELTPQGQKYLPERKKFTASVEHRSVSDVLDWLCTLDPTFVWQRDERTANFFPRRLAGQQNYLMNRRISTVSFQAVDSAADAVGHLSKMLNPPEQLAVLTLGTDWKFAKPWTAEFHDLTMRQVMNRIAVQLGPTNGWQLGGTETFRFVTFHTRLGSPPGLTPPSKPQGHW